MVAGFDDDRLVPWRASAHDTLSRGEHLFVDDLVTGSRGAGRGYG